MPNCSSRSSRSPSSSPPWPSSSGTPARSSSPSPASWAGTPPWCSASAGWRCTCRGATRMAPHRAGRSASACRADDGASSSAHSAGCATPSTRWNASTRVRRCSRSGRRWCTSGSGSPCCRRSSSPARHPPRSLRWRSGRSDSSTARRWCRRRAAAARSRWRSAPRWAAQSRQPCSRPRSCGGASTPSTSTSCWAPSRPAAP